ncbi:hypothetical protein GIB67_021024 [Kingdonia uniflora]|uniref:Ataxin 2 SM domain-containing protein n=1 Tax=Kingdonia uniflora TaxID=39325 RepID=A0A7J7N6V5_9MAGN|nr:hypothetical protein GIB67_021024 [Kingdonia uniflora]
MVCKTTRDLSEENAISPGINESLLYYIMFLISLPIEAHTRDGSIYSGIFYTVCPQNDNEIVLKNAKMVKKGRRGTNVGFGVVVETLVIGSRDLVQILAKDVVPLVDGDDGIDGFRGVNGSVWPMTFTLPSGKAVPKVFASKKKKSKKARVSRKTGITSIVDVAQTNDGNDLLANLKERHDAKEVATKSIGNGQEIENGKVDVVCLVKMAEASIIQATTEGQVGSDKSQEGKIGSTQKFEAREDNIIHKPQFSKISSNRASCVSPVSSLLKPDIKDYDRPTSTDFASSDVRALDSLMLSSPVEDTTLSTSPHSPALVTDLIAPNASASIKNEKAFKLNPGAKTFSPVSAVPKLSAHPTPVTATSVAYIPNSLPAVPVADIQLEVGIGPFAPYSPLPVKFVEHSNLLAVNGDNGSQYAQSIVGHLGSRLQPVRYATQYNAIQAGLAYTHPNHQPIVVERHPLLYPHQVSQDVMHAATTPVLCAHPPFAHQTHFLKHQGCMSSQTFQVCAPPRPFMGSAQQPFAGANHIPYPQPSLSAVRPITLLGVNPHLGHKFM